VLICEEDRLVVRAQRTRQLGEAGDFAYSRTIVRRGEHAMPVGDQLPVTLPADARRVNASGT